MSQHQVVILGAGMSGLCMGVQLRKAGIHDFVILEKQPGLGGTWWDNTYPGAHVDVPAPAYSFSFAPNRHWKRRFPAASEIQSYMQRVATEHGLMPHIRLDTRMTDATFDEATGQWAFTTDKGDKLQAQFFVCSTGPLNQLRWPDIPGLTSFAGKRLHSARWDHGYDMAGKRIGVIGTGSTASQLIPPVAARAGKLHVFQRTANWVLPRLDRRYVAIDAFLARFRLYTHWVRRAWAGALEMGRRGFDEGTLMRKIMLGQAAGLMKKQLTDATLRTKLTPPYPLGCKRIIYSNDFYPALAQPHVELVTDKIERITATGIVTSDGQARPLDVLVCATGFDVAHVLSSVNITGQNGQDLQKSWTQGPQAYHGISVAGFPNMFLLLGPNTATGHTSTLLYIEPEVAHAIACMRAVKSGLHRWITVRPEVMATHNDGLQKRLGDSVWSKCNSWYRVENGRIVALFPGFTKEYVDSLKQLRKADYLFG